MGSTLHILKTNKNGLNKLLLTRIIFQNFNINGIKVMTNDFNSQSNDNNIELKVVFYGNRFLTVYQLLYNEINEKLSLNQLMKSHNFHDWIIDVRLSHEIVFIVKAHNEVVVLNWKTNHILNTIQGLDKCILYSAFLLYTSLSPLGFVLSSGTVFKEIVIWSSFDDNCDHNSNTVQRLRGHDGVIFAINYNQELNTLVSASDDRSVRIWTAINESNSSFNSKDFWNNNKFSLSHIFYGHLARIWSVVTISNPYPIVISVGEDSSLCFWNINDKKLVQKVDGHKNSSIWSLALDSESLIAYSGGSDSCLTSFDIINILTKFKSVVKCNLDPKTVSFISGDKLFSSTNSGDLIIISMLNNDVISLSNSETKDKKFCAIDINEERNQILLGSNCGNIAIIKINNKNENPYNISIKKVHNEKVFSVCFVDCHNFMSCSNKGEVFLLDSKTFSQLGEYQLPNSRHRWPVAGLLFGQMLIIGDRCGSVFVYLKSKRDPTQEYRNLHARNGVTAIRLKPKTNFMYSSGRNGKIFEYLLEETKCSLLRTFRIFTDMEWIGKFLFDKSGQLSYICGFESRNFVVWDEREQRFVYSIECGGGHRSWDFTVDENELYFCYTKQEKLICFNKHLSKIHNSNDGMISSLTTTSHCKKINCCSILFNGNMNSSISYFATAGEDNVININSLDTKTNQFKVELVLCGHISNISAIAVCCAQLYSVCYMVSVGGRSQLMLWRIEIKDQNIICKEIISNFLWLSDGIYRKSRKNTNSFLNDPQIRYLDASISKINEEKYLISTACSDSAFRLFIFDEILNTLTLISITSFNTSCVLKIINIFTTHIITASSDGTLKIWSLLENLFENLSIDPMVDSQMNLNSVFEMRFHESGINSLDVIQVNDIYLIASGGDDNSLILSLLKSSNNCLNRICFVEEKYVHSSQITGIRIITNDTILSVSIDQRVIVWKFNLNIEHLSLKLEPISSYISCIADISSFCATFDSNQNKWQLIVCGEGFEAIKYSLR